MASFADQDLGSESDDDNFNPVQEIGSDDEGAVAEDSLEVSRPKSEASGQRPQISRQSSEVKDEDEDGEAKQQDGIRGGAEDEDDENKQHVDGVNREQAAQDEEGEEEDADQRDEERDEDEEEDEDDEDEDEVHGRPRKRHKRDRRLQFIDVEAEVDEDEEDEVDDDEELGGEAFIADTHPDDLAELPAGVERDDRRHRELDRRRELEDNMDAEKQAEALRARYGRHNRVTHVENTAVVPQRLLLPSVDDPTIWGVKVKPGKEREVVFSIVKRYEDRLMTREPLAITSALERGGTMTGYVYVEARKQADVMTATEGISFCYPRTKMILVPIKEMPDLLRITKSKPLEPGMYVRIKRGKYAGDLAQIEEVESNDLDVVVRIVPRLDYGLNEDANAPVTDASAAKRKRPGFGSSTNRPPQRLFSEIEAKKKHAKYLQQVSSLDKKHWQYLSDSYISGFLIKDMKIQHLQTEDVYPTLEEVTRFTSGAADGTENLDLSALAATLKAGNSNSSYLPGDMVEIYEGEQQGVTGKATAVVGDIVTLTVTEGQLRGQTVEAPVKSLRKRFRPGDHVKVIGGSKYHDEVGMVVRIKDDRVSILSDSTNQEITVFSKDLREATNSSGASGASNFDLLDLVQLDPATVACVVKVDREALRVLDQNGSVRSILPSSVSNKLERRRHAVSTDRDGNEIRHDDTVKEVIGEQKQGRVIHIHRNFLFIQNRQQSENSGMFVARNTNVQTVAAKGGRSTGPDLMKMNPGRQANGAGNGSAMPPPRQIGRDRLIGKTVMCKKGLYKGLLGIVKDSTDFDARVEFHAKNKVITIPKDSLVVKDPVTGATIDMKFGAGRGRGLPGPGGLGGATPGWVGSRTPMVPNGSKTPGWGAAGSRTPAPAWNGGKTPAWSGGGSKTPAWAGDGSRTVNPYAEGNRTSYGGATTSWNPNTRTPYHASSGFDSGSKTPAYNAFDSSRTPAYTGSKTPAYGGSTAWSSNANQPVSANQPSSYGGTWSRPLDAPTPGFNSAPTPGDNNHPTPGPGGYTGQGGGAGGYGARRGMYGTPAASAPTPGAYPETPGAFGAADEDPRYE